MVKRWFGDSKFYKMVFAIALPIIIQNSITQLVSLLDNIMIGNVGTYAMSGVSITSQLLNIYTLAIFGTVNAVGIYCAQYAGKNDYQGVKNCLNIKFYFSIIISALFILILSIFKEPLINSYLDPSTNTIDAITATRQYAFGYLKIMLIGMIPYTITQCFSSTYREVGETKLPLVGSTIALITNAVLNYLLIFGKFGLPELGIYGAAIATVISRFIELAIIYFVGIRHKDVLPFMKRIFNDLTINIKLIRDILIKALPLIINEIIWSTSIAGINQCYSARSITAVAVFTIVGNIQQLYSIICNALAISTSIIVGQGLGTGDKDKAYDVAIKMMVFNTIISSLLGIIFYFLSPIFPSFYNTTDEIKYLSVILLRVISIKLPIHSIYMSCYFILRAGGVTFITFLFDSVFSAVICWPFAFVLANYTTLTLVVMYILVNLLDLLKVAIGIGLVSKGVWVKTLVNN